MNHEDPVLKNLHAEATAVGEIDSFTTEVITIRGSFNPGDVIALHPGARVFLLTDDTAIDLMSRQFEMDF